MADNSNSQQSFLNNLFQWTIKNTTEEAAAAAAPTTTASRQETMSEENRAWLNSALDNVSINPVERLKIAIQQIKDPQTNDEQRKAFLDELCHWTEELDLAKDFFAVGGLDILAPLLDYSDDQIRMGTCSLLATLVQNNDHCQRIIVQSGLQEKLLKILDQSNNPELQTKALTAISALIRGYTLGQLQLQKYQGPKVLLRSLALPVPRLQTKICFLVNTICSSSAHMKKIFFENGALDEFIRAFDSDTCPDHHHFLQTILTLSTAKANALAERDPALLQTFQQHLTQRLGKLDHPDDHQDEIGIIHQLQSLAKGSSTDSK